MPLPLLFIGIAALTGLAGTGTTVKAVIDNTHADSVNTAANRDVDNAKKRLELQRTATAASLEQLGKEKLHILTGSVKSFVDAFEQIKNIDFTSSVGLEELNRLHIDKHDFEELKALGNFAIQVAGGATAGIAGGALAALGAYGAAQTFACASTGTAIAALHGVAATNATLAFFGGGSLAAGGLGIAGGTMVLGGLVAGPALLVLGLITGAKAQEKLDKALANRAQAAEIAEALGAATDQCIAIRRRSYMFYNLLASLDAVFQPIVWQTEDILAKYGTDYRIYSPEAKKVIMAAASSAGSIKAVLDVPILTNDGALTEESEAVVRRIGTLLYTQQNA